MYKVDVPTIITARSDCNIIIRIERARVANPNQASVVGRFPGCFDGCFEHSTGNK